MLTRADIEKYFIAEKQESLLFLIVGIAAIIFAIIAIAFLKTSFWKGAALPLIVVGLIQTVVGFTVYNRSDEDRSRNVYAFSMVPDEFKSKELPRMQTVNKNFVIYRWVEIVLLLSGLTLMLKFKEPINASVTWGGNNFWYGLGVFLAIQSALMLGADYFAEKRAKLYTTQIQDFISRVN